MTEISTKKIKGKQMLYTIGSQSDITGYRALTVERLLSLHNCCQTLMLRAAVLLRSASTADAGWPPSPSREADVPARFSERRLLRHDRRVIPTPVTLVPLSVKVVRPRKDATASMASSSTLR